MWFSITKFYLAFGIFNIWWVISLCSLTNFAILLLLQSYCPSLPCLLQLHMPHCHTPPSYMHPIIIPLLATCASQLHGYVANPLLVAHPTWPCISQPYISYCHTPSSYMHPFLIAANLAAAHATLLSPSQPHTLHCHLLIPTQPHCGPPCSYTHHVATPIVATYAILPHTLQPHGPYHCPPCSHTHLITMHLTAAWQYHCLSYSHTHHHMPCSYTGHIAIHLIATCHIAAPLAVLAPDLGLLVIVYSYRTFVPIHNSRNIFIESYYGL